MYKFKKKRTKRPYMPKQPPRAISGDQPPLTGQVHGFSASDIEERFARACYKNKVKFWFKVEFDVLTTLMGEKKEIDFVLELPIPQTVDIDGEFAHKTTEQKGKDALRDALLNNELLKLGYRVPHIRVEWWRLETQEEANRTVQSIIAGGL